MAMENGVISNNPCTFKVSVPKIEKKVLSSLEANTLLLQAKIQIILSIPFGQWLC